MKLLEQILKISTAVGGMATLIASAHAAMPMVQQGLQSNFNCPNCRIKNTQTTNDPGFLLGKNVAAILNHPSALNFPKASMLKTSEINWDGVSDLPGGLKKEDFDPSFRTSYWSESTGPINTPSAPWNRLSPYLDLNFAESGIPVAPFAGLFI
ncbi:MAG: hypothetical protein AABZ06_14645 [Bdellovibrionota bacterium]